MCQVFCVNWECLLQNSMKIEYCYRISVKLTLKSFSELFHILIIKLTLVSRLFLSRDYQHWVIFFPRSNPVSPTLPWCHTRSYKYNTHLREHKISLLNHFLIISFKLECNKKLIWSKICSTVCIQSNKI